MQAILMAGGRGTRLRPFTAVLPKPLVPIGEKSIMEIVLDQLRTCGFDDIIIAVGHKAELIMAVIGDGDRFGLTIRYHYEEAPLGTIGALASMEDLDENFLVMNGDICTNLNFGSFFEKHVRSGARATISAYARRERIELGVLKPDDSTGTIVGFEEKPTFDFLVSMGVNAFNRSILELIPKDEFFGFDHLMHAMLEKKVRVGYELFDGRWHDIGRPDDYNTMLEEFERDPNLFVPEGKVR